ncbi:MAG: lytic transglycosylase domain-containing protein [Micromonosporaceae bacterium]
MRHGVGHAGKAVATSARALARFPARAVSVIRSGNALLQRPGTRLGLHGLALLAVLGAAIYTGLYVVPSGAHTRPASAPSSAAPSGAPVEAPAGDSPQTAAPSAAPSQPPGGTERPQDALAGWASSLRHLEIPQVALQAYGYAEMALAQTQPGCHLTWPTLAGIGRIESNHGRSHGAELLDDGRSQPPVVGLPLDGGPERKEIRDTDDGELDGDTTYDRAVGAMQFIPSTWGRWATDGDGDGRTDPFDIDDAALAAARYLCAGGKDLATGEGWTGAILSYNRMDVYVRDVFAAADAYGRASHGAG